MTTITGATASTTVKDIYDSKKFIEIVLIRDTELLLKSGFDYFSFVIIAQGIEVLGSFFDRQNFDCKGKSQNRFRKAIKKLFPQEYHDKDELLYVQLRCGLAHLLKPKSSISLSSNKSNSTNDMHLTQINGKILLVADKLFEDFKDACNKVIAMIDDSSNTEIISTKKNAINLVISEHLVQYKTYVDSGTTSTTI